MWYSTKEEAEEACKEKEKKFKEPFVALKDKVDPIWWAQRKSALIDR
jgi:hypothetical protein